jgi:RNA polymerase sigma factor (sigma-70 family)
MKRRAAALSGTFSGGYIDPAPHAGSPNGRALRDVSNKEDAIRQRRDPRLAEKLATDLDDWFPELVRAEMDNVYSALRRLGGLGAEADDVAQETFVRAYSALAGYSADRIANLRLRPWLITIALNLRRNELRRRARHAAEPLPEFFEVEEDGETPEDVALRSDDRSRLAAAVQALPAVHREPVVLRHVVGLSIREIADVLERQPGTVKVQIARGMTAMRERMERMSLEETQ